MERYDLDIFGVSECRWIGVGRKKISDGFIILFFGKENVYVNGVVFIINRSIEKIFIEWEFVSDRIIRVRFYFKYCKFIIL